MAGDFATLKTVGAAPDGEHELGDELFWPVATITLRLRQTTSGECLIKSQVIEHLFRQCHTTLGGDFFIGK
ncbi:MAG: hypothetical protein H7252_08865 [Cytophaga sp.]|nr:hypothetical protein [Undibacterium sp.]